MWSLNPAIDFGGLPALPAGYAFAVGNSGNYLVDNSGNYLIVSE